MDRTTLIQALHSTTVAEGQKQAGEFLDQPPANRDRCTTTSSDGADWRNLSLLIPDDDDAISECSENSSSCEDESLDERKRRISGLMQRWRNAARRARHYHHDPWSNFCIISLPVTRAKRYRYSSIRKMWTEDIVEVRLHPEPFARGAMRECYRLKKLSSLVQSDNWELAHNYVAKRYIHEVDRNVLFEDVRLQMDAKLWAEEFNRYNPPKKIDIVQMCVVEMIDLPGEPLYHLEHFIEGDYVKYNSNSGFVSDVARKTPQAFSHFTFERSGHQMMVVDIQGVGDLYTDPQIHTVGGTDYGDGNLGTRGMALFFHSHICNDICHSLCLTEFDLSENEKLALEEGPSVHNTNASTMFSKEANVCTAIVPELYEEDAMECLRQRTISIRSRSSSEGPSRQLSTTSLNHDEDCECETCLQECIVGVNIETFANEDDGPETSEADRSTTSSPLPPAPRKVAFHTLSLEREDKRHRYDSCGSSAGTSSIGGSSRLTRETEREEYWSMARKQSIPAGVMSAIELQKLAEECHRINHHASILGQIHLDIARYHELGRFLPDDDAKKKIAVDSTCGGGAEDLDLSTEAIPFDRESALFHLEVAKRCGLLEAILTMAQMLYGHSHELLKDVVFPDDWKPHGSDEDFNREECAFELMESAADMGDRGAMLFVAEAYETGLHRGTGAQPSFPRAIEWYQKAVGFSDDDSEGSYRPRYEILARMAEMYAEGGCGLQQDFERAYNLYNEAAEVAMEAMKGKLATKYYEKAEMCAC